MPLILVVEDDPDVRQTVVEFLGALGHEVLSARSSAEARALLGQRSVHLLLADCVMQGEPGPSLAEHARSLGIPVILTSGHPDYLETAAASSVGVLQKPFRLEALAAQVAAALSPSPA
jgi:two-component system, OmpR family, response regulator